MTPPSSSHEVLVRSYEQYTYLILILTWQPAHTRDSALAYILTQQLLLQVVDEIFDRHAAARMGIDKVISLLSNVLRPPSGLHCCTSPIFSAVTSSPTLSCLVLFCFSCYVMSCLVFFVFSCYALSYHHFSSLPCQVGQICIMIHSGSRGLGHQVATDALIAMETAMARDNLITNDRQLACARINSKVLRTTLHATPRSTHTIHYTAHHTPLTISRSKHHISALYTAHHASHYTAFYATLHISSPTPALHTASCFPLSPLHNSHTPFISTHYSTISSQLPCTSLILHDIFLP